MHENLIKIHYVDFQGEIDLCGALLLAARSSSYVEIRNDIGSFYFKMNSANQFESWCDSLI